MTLSNLPPGVYESEIPGNGPEYDGQREDDLKLIATSESAEEARTVVRTQRERVRGILANALDSDDSVRRTIAAGFLHLADELTDMIAEASGRF